MWKVKCYTHTVIFLWNDVIRSRLSRYQLCKKEARDRKRCVCVCYFIFTTVCFRNERNMGEAVCFAAAHTNSIGLSQSPAQLVPYKLCIDSLSNEVFCFDQIPHCLSLLV